MNKPLTALVVGGGIAGTATAIALTKAGIQTTIVEARSAGNVLDGVFLTLAPNGIDALRAIEADKCASGLGFSTPGMDMRNHTGKLLGTTSTGSAANGTTSRTLLRTDLNAALQAEAIARGTQIERGRRVQEVTEIVDGVRAEFSDGSQLKADLLVGADGVYSTIRHQIDSMAAKPSYTGLLTTGGYASGVTVDIAPGNYEMIFGKKAFFGYATAPDGVVWWFVNVPQSREPAKGELAAISIEQWRTRFAELYGEDWGPALQLIAATPEFAPMTAIHTVPWVRRWHSDRMVLVGDAAHAPSPTSGQGASLSIEDAVVLAMCLRDFDSPAAAFAKFEGVRRGRAERILKAASEPTTGSRFPRWTRSRPAGQPPGPVRVVPLDRFADGVQLAQSVLAERSQPGLTRPQWRVPASGGRSGPRFAERQLCRKTSSSLTAPRRRRRCGNNCASRQPPCPPTAFVHGG